MAIKVATSKLSDLLKSRPYIVEGDGVLTTCPIHADGQEANPSLRITINEKGGLGFTCRSHGCHKTNFLDILRSLGIDNARSGWTYGDIETNFANGASEPVTAEHIEALRFHIEEINPDQKVLDYVRGRWGLTYDDVANLGIGKDKAWTYSGADHRAHRVFVPFYDFHGIPRGGQARATSPDRNPRWSSLKNPEGHAWSRLAVFDRAEEAIGDWFVITEGPGDGLTAYAAGFSAASIRGATLASDETLSRALKAGTKHKTVVIAGDQDEAGRKFVDTLLAILPDALVLPMPKGIKDLSEWYEGAPDGFSDVVLRALRNAKGRDQTGPFVDDNEIPKTDQQMAKRIIRDLDGLVRYVPGVGLYRWVKVNETSGYWDVDETELVVTDYIDDKNWHIWESANRVKSAATQLERQRSIIVSPDDLDKHPNLINVGNGTFDINTGELREARPEDLITHRIPYNYDPDAPADRWNQFLEEVFLDDGVADYMQRLVGYGVTGYTSEEIFAIFYGHGANGKSKFLEAITHVFQATARTAEFETFTKKRGDKIRNDIARLRGARLVHASEGGAMDHMDEALLKTLTGQDKMTARFLNKENFEFTPTFLLLLASNFKPNFLEQGHGLWRRIRLINFRATFEGENRDYSLGEKLKAEAEGILAWALHGAVEWRANGLQDPDSVLAATEEYREEANGLDGFVPGWFEVTEDEEDKVLAKDVWTAYNIWCRWNFTQAWKQRTLNNAIVARGADKRKGTQNKTTFYGLKYVGPDDTPTTLDELLREG